MGYNHKVVSLCNQEFFQFGEMFIKTRDKIDADYFVYGPDLTDKQINVLNKHIIVYRQTDKNEFDTKMQYLKFQFLINEMTGSGCGMTLTDFDVIYVKDWGAVFKNDFDIGIMVRNDCIKKQIYRAYASGGIILCKDTIKSKQFCNYALNVMKNGGDKNLPEYDFIFKTFEPGSNRPSHKCHSRKKLRWWVDQVFLSALVLKGTGGTIVGDKKLFDFNGFKVCLFNGNSFQKLDPVPTDYNSNRYYILQLKRSGRKILSKFSK